MPRVSIDSDFYDDDLDVIDCHRYNKKVKKNNKYEDRIHEKEINKNIDKLRKFKIAEHTD